MGANTLATLHILNGTCLLKHLQQGQPQCEEVYVPFNEAMSHGATHPENSDIACGIKPQAQTALSH